MWKMSGHQCQWEEVRRVFIPSPNSVNMGAMEIKGRDGIADHYDYLNRITFGVTSIELKCADCGDVIDTVLLGDHTK